MKRLALAPVLLLVTTTATLAQEPSKGWVDVNFGVAIAAGDSYEAAVNLPQSLELATYAAAYSFPRGAAFDFGGGYMFTPRVGIGLSFTGTAHEDIAGLAISIPHPTRFNLHADDATVTTGKLRRVEGGVNIQAMVVAVDTGAFRLRVFGGPTYFRVRQDTVTSIDYDQVFNLLGFNSVGITTYDTEESEGTGWGFHGGTDVSYFFSRVVGIGGQVRVSRGSVTIDDLDGTVESDIKTGGFQFGGGLRLRF